MSFAHGREHLKVKYIGVRALGVRERAMVTVRVMVRVRDRVRGRPGGPGVPTSSHAYQTRLVANPYTFYLCVVRRYLLGVRR